MTTPLIERAAPDALAVQSASERLIELRIMPWDVIAETPQGPESFARGAFAGTDPRRVVIESGAVPGPPGSHGGFRLVGRGEALDERDDAAYLLARIAPTPAGDELLALADAGVLQDASVTFAPVKQRRGRKGQTERTAVDLRRVAVLERGAYPGATVIAVRAEDQTMVETIETAETAEVPAFDPAPLLARLDGAETASRAAWDALSGRVAAVEAAGGVGLHPLARFGSFAEYCRAAFTDPLLSRALADEITTDNPGLVPPAWLREIVRIPAARAPAITAFGGARALPATGMSFNWPTYAGDIKVLVTKQATQKAALNSLKISFGSASQAIDSYGFAHDVAYQLMLRGDPSYLEAANRVLLAAYAYYEDNALVTAIAAASGTGTSDWNEATGTADQLRAALVAASIAIEAATGAPAEFVLAGDAIFGKIAGLSGLWPATYGTANVAGIASARTLVVEVSGVPVIHDPFLNTNTAFASNGLAASYFRDGPRMVSAEDVERLGRNEAIWGMGASAIFIPAGIVFLSKVAGPGILEGQQPEPEPPSAKSSSK